MTLANFRFTNRICGRPLSMNETGIWVCHFQNVTNIMSIVYECALYLYRECGVKYSSIDIAAISKVEIERCTKEKKTHTLKPPER